MTKLRKQEKSVENGDIIALLQTIKHFIGGTRQKAPAEVSPFKTNLQF